MIEASSQSANHLPLRSAIVSSTVAESIQLVRVMSLRSSISWLQCFKVCEQLLDPWLCFVVIVVEHSGSPHVPSPANLTSIAGTKKFLGPRPAFADVQCVGMQAARGDFRLTLHAGNIQSP